MSVSHNSSHPLDHPIWTALTTTQQALAEGDARARRYPIEVTPFADMPDPISRVSRRSGALMSPHGYRRAVHLGSRKGAGRIQGHAGGYRRTADRDADRDASQWRRYCYPRRRRRSGR